MSSTTTQVTSRAGIGQWQRRWAADVPRASVLLVHGIGEHSGRYEHVGDALAAQGFDTLAFDLRGHGESGGRRGHVDRFDDFLDDVEELLAARSELGVPVVLFGHSLGGLIAANYVVRGRPAPDLLVLSAPALQAEVPAWQRAMATALGRVVPKLAVPNSFDGSLLSRDEVVANTYRDDPLRVKVATTRLGVEMFAAMAATYDAVQTITIPTYVLHGSADNLIKTTATEPFVGMDNAERVVHDGLRHECLNEPEQQAVIDGITTWLDGQLAKLAKP